MEETEDDGEDEYITLVQFVTDVISKDLVVLVLSVYYSCAFVFKNTSYILNVFKTYPNVVQIIYYLGKLSLNYLKHSNGSQKFSLIYNSSINAR